MEEIFGWTKTTGGFCKTRFIGLARTRLAGLMVAASYAKHAPHRQVATRVIRRDVAFGRSPAALEVAFGLALQTGSCRAEQPFVNALLALRFGTDGTCRLERGNGFVRGPGRGQDDAFGSKPDGRSFRRWRS